MLSFLGNNTLPRGLRNNNPGNLVFTSIPWQGKLSYAENHDWKNTPGNVVKEFEQFKSINYGIRAMAMDLLGDIKDGLNTIRKLITEYSPPGSNNTAGYINYVAQQTGTNPDAPIQVNANILAHIIQAQIAMENGENAAALVPLQEIYNSIKLLPAVLLKELGQVITNNPVKTGLTVAAMAALAYGGYRYLKRAA